MKKSLVASMIGISSSNLAALRSASSCGEIPSRSAAMLDRLAVLVGAGEEEDVLPPLAHVAREHVGRDRRVGVAEVRLGVDVVDRGGDVEAHRAAFEADANGPPRRAGDD